MAHFALAQPFPSPNGATLSEQEQVANSNAIGNYLKAMNAADQMGNYQAAVSAAQDCSKLNAMTIQKVQCEEYYGNALLTGVGISKDEHAGFQVFREIANGSPESSDALKLAQLYLDGVGGPSNPVEAAVVVWRAEHGVGSAYGAAFGECDGDGCEALWAAEPGIDSQLKSELTDQQWREADELERERYPEIESVVTHRDNETKLVHGAIWTILLALLIWLFRLKGKRTVLT